MRLFSDQKTLLLTAYQAQGAVIGDALANEAIAAAYRKIAGALPWSYLHRRTQINTVAPYSTGTVAFTAATRTLTLTGGTWPTWAASGLILIGNQAYAVQTRVDGTSLILMADRCPLTDLAALTTYKIMQIEYVLPNNFVRVEELIQMGTVWTLFPMQHGSMLDMTRLFYNPTRPWQYLVRGSNYATGRMAIEFAPPPDSAYIYDMSYYAKPRQRTLTVEATAGTVSVVGTAVTGTGTAFTQAMVGCQLRQGTAAAVPVGDTGTLGSIAENTISTVTDATHLTLLDAGQTLGSVKYLIDDPIDVDRLSMDEAFCRMCEFEFATLSRNQNRSEREREMVTALINARAADVRMSQRWTNWGPPSAEQLIRANLGGR